IESAGATGKGNATPAGREPGTPTATPARQQRREKKVPEHCARQERTPKRSNQNQLAPSHRLSATPAARLASIAPTTSSTCHSFESAGALAGAGAGAAGGRREDG